MSVTVKLIDSKGNTSTPLSAGCFGFVTQPNDYFKNNMKMKRTDADYLVYTGQLSGLMNMHNNNKYISLMSKALPTKKFVHYMPTNVIDFMTKGMQISTDVPASVMVGLFEVYRHMFNKPHYIQHVLQLHGFTNDILLAWYMAKFTYNPYTPANAANLIQGNPLEPDLLPATNLLVDGHNPFSEEVMHLIDDSPSFRDNPSFYGIFELFKGNKKSIRIKDIPNLHPYLTWDVTSTLLRGVTNDNEWSALADKLRKDRKHMQTEHIQKLMQLIKGE